MSQQLNETSLGSVFGAAGDSHGGIFIGPLRGASKKVMRRRLLYPTYKNSVGKNILVHNALSEEYIYNTEGKKVTGSDVELLCELGLTNKMMYKGGKFLHVEPKCASFPYCDQGAPDKPVRLISGTKQGMCEGCGDFCSVIAEQAGKSFEYIAEGFRNHTLNKLSEMTIMNEQKNHEFLSSIENSVHPDTYTKIKEFIETDKLNPDKTFNDLLEEVAHLMVKPKLRELSESIEKQDNPKKQNQQEMKGKKLELKNIAKANKKQIMESLMKSSVGKCVSEQLQSEGFLPHNDELNESLTLESSMETMMEDADLIDEMFDAVVEAKCDCSENIEKHIRENFDWSKNSEEDDEEEEADLDQEVEDEIDNDSEIAPLKSDKKTLEDLIDNIEALQLKYSSGEDDSDISASISGILIAAKDLKDEDGPTEDNIDLGDDTEGDIDLETDIDTEDDIDLGDDTDAIDVNVDTEDDIDLGDDSDIDLGADSDGENELDLGDEISSEDDVDLDLNAEDEPLEGETSTFQSLIDSIIELQTEYSSSEEHSNILASLTDMLNTAKDLKNQEDGIDTDSEIDDEIDVEGDIDLEDDSIDEIDGDDIITKKQFSEADSSKKATPVLDSKITASNKKGSTENDKQAKDAISSQKPNIKKTDSITPKKFEATKPQKKIEVKNLGRGNALDYDYDTELSEERKEVIKTQVRGVPPKDHVNVDHDSKTGEALLISAKDRSPQVAATGSSIPDAVIEKEDESYEKTTAVNEDLMRMRNLIMFDATKLKDKKKRDKIDEVKFLTEKIQKKKFL